MNVPETMSDKETSRTVDGSSKARYLKALAGLLITILLLFVPFWIIAGYALMAVWSDFPPFVLWCMAAGSLVICAIVAGRLILTKRKCITWYGRLIVCGLLVINAIITAKQFHPLAELQYKVDRIYFTENICKVSEGLRAYYAEHGGYPPQQDMKSLLDTLGIRKSDLRYTLFYDITSAEYHASNLNLYDPAANPDDPIFSLRVKPYAFGHDACLCVRNDGSIFYRDFETGAKL